MNKQNQIYINLRVCALTITTLVLVWQLSGCDMFEPRTPEDPGDSGDKVAFVPASDPAGIFVNLRSGIENRLQGANYERSLADNFNFIPFDQDAIDLPGVDWTNWTKAVELAVLDLMISEAKDASVSFDRTVLLSESDFVQFRVTYELQLTSTATSIVSTYQGVAQFDVRRTSGIWELERWEDVEKVTNVTTWGYYKGILRGRLES